MTDKVTSHKPSRFRHMRRPAMRIAIIALSTYVSVCVGVAVFQSRLIYFPSTSMDLTPSDVGLTYEDVKLTTDDGLTLHGWYLPHDEAQGCILFCHGNAGNISDRLNSLKLLHGIGYSVLIFDYRGYGNSQGSPTERGTYLDAEAAWRYLTDVYGLAAERIVIFGRSLGGGVAVELAIRHPPGALVIDSSFSSLADVARIHYPLLPVDWILRHRYDSAKKIAAIGCPKLFFHGSRDSLIPIRLGRKLFEAATGTKEFIETPSGHLSAGFDYSPTYTALLARFLCSAL